MSVDILLTVIATSIIQSIFGVGVLLFGTPIMLLIGYDFITTLIVLLPISISINLFQVKKHYHHIDTEFYKKILIFTIPFVMLFLFIITTSKLNIGVIIIGLFLVFVAFKNLSPKITKLVDSLIRYEKTYFITMGIVHGLTNLGGSLLTAIVHSKNYPKDAARVTIAASYSTFAVFQLIILFFSIKLPDLQYAEKAIYLLVGVLMFFLTEKMVYTNINNNRYTKIFAIFLFISGVLLVFKST